MAKIPTNRRRLGQQARPAQAPTARSPVASQPQPVARVDRPATPSQSSSPIVALFVVALLLVVVVLCCARLGSNNNVNRSQPIAVRNGYVSAINLNLRAGPGIHYGVLRVLPQNTQVYYLSETQYADNATWVKVQVGSQVGWVNQQHLR